MSKGTNKKKYWDFLFLDVAILQLAYWGMLSSGLIHTGYFDQKVYTIEATLLFLCQIVVIFSLELYADVLYRGPWQDFKNVFVETSAIVITNIAALYFLHYGAYISRRLLAYTAVIYFVFLFLVILGWKKIRISYLINQKVKAIIVVAPSQYIVEIMQKQSADHLRDFEIVGIFMPDYREGERYWDNDIPVYGDLEAMQQYVKTHYVEDALVYFPNALDHDQSVAVKTQLQQMGLSTITPLYSFTDNENAIKRIKVNHDGITLIESYVNQPRLQLIVKRGIDIVIGFIGSVFCLITWGILSAVNGRNGAAVFEQYSIIGRMGKVVQLRNFKCKNSFFKHLPEALTVFSGEISFVGLQKNAADQWERDTQVITSSMPMKPGMICCADENSYISNWTLFSDLQVLVMAITRTNKA